MNKKLLILLVFIAVMGGAYLLWPNSTPAVAQNNKINNEADIKQAEEYAEKVYKAFESKNQKKCKNLMVPIDSHGYKAINSNFSKLKSPRFSEALVYSPQVKPDLLYVYVPCEGKKYFQFVLVKDKEKNTLKMKNVFFAKKISK